ncbi:hypothetical protein [Streptomyces sp. NPDC003247]|uniref:hypothetical protein n=1 Tax=Streptomyces sp. NPDC003247 TaxID=3364677 RepID=UPI00369A0DAD
MAYLFLSYDDYETGGMGAEEGEAVLLIQPGGRSRVLPPFAADRTGPGGDQPADQPPMNAGKRPCTLHPALQPATTVGKRAASSSAAGTVQTRCQRLVGSCPHGHAV